MNKNEAGKEGAEDVEDIDVEEVEGDEEEGDESEKDEKPEDKDEKPVETPEAKAARLLRQTNQARKKLGLEPLGEAKPEKKSKKSDSLDYGEKAFLIANGIKETEEMELVQEVMKSTGKSLDEVVGSRFFQAELKEMREDKTTTEAIPKGNKRGNNSASNTVEYWIAKGELPPKDQRELRAKVVDARIKAESGKSQFTDTPVAPKY